MDSYDDDRGDSQRHAGEASPAWGAWRKAGDFIFQVPGGFAHVIISVTGSIGDYPPARYHGLQEAVTEAFRESS